MKFQEKRTLACRGPVDQLADESLDRIVMVGDVGLLGWENDHSNTGYDHCMIFPAIDRGERAFLLVEDWCASEHYCAEGTQESILTLEEGIKLILEHGDMDYMWNMFNGGVERK